MPEDPKRISSNHPPEVPWTHQSGFSTPSLSRPGTGQEAGVIQVETPILGNIQRFKAYQAAKITIIHITVFIVVIP